MRANPSPMSVTDYCSDLNQKKIIVNEDYQRQQGLWTSAAKSYFIESIVLEYPIPKLFLYASLDLKTRATIKEIVDGQQRSRALQDFFNDKLRLSKTLETEGLRGRKYSEIDDEHKTRFLSYSLPIDQFSGVPEDDVQEAFRRMNANNVPLNAEEQRNARYQGNFKWLIISVAKDYRSFLTKIGVFSRRDILRMTDLRHYAEIVYAIDEGFDTVKGSNIDKLYKKYNDEFSEEDDYAKILRCGIDLFVSNDTLHLTPFLRGHMFQSIVLALIDLKCGRKIAAMADKVAPAAAKIVASKHVSLEQLSHALTDPEAHPNLSDFVQASTTKTNVAASKAIRFIYLRQALEGAV
jgi:hypothetical protein